MYRELLRLAKYCNEYVWVCASACACVCLFDRVDLIKPVSNVRSSVRPCVVRPSTKSFFEMKFGMYVEGDEWCTTVYPILGQDDEPFKVGNPAIFKSYLLRHLQWELATDNRFLNQGTISKFDRAGFLIFRLLFVSWLWSWHKRQLWRVDRVNLFCMLPVACPPASLRYIMYFGFVNDMFSSTMGRIAVWISLRRTDLNLLIYRNVGQNSIS